MRSTVPVRVYTVCDGQILRMQSPLSVRPFFLSLFLSYLLRPFVFSSTEWGDENILTVGGQQVAGMFSTHCLSSVSVVFLFAGT